MAALHISNVPERVVAALEERARRNQRTLEGELRRILAHAVREVPQRPVEPIRLHQSTCSTKAAWSRRDWYGDDGR